MTDQSNPLIIPALRPLYDNFSDLVFALTRFVIGATFVPHGYVKLFTGNIQNVAKGMAANGLEPALVVAYSLGALEFFGGILLAIGLLTRPVAFLFFVEMAVATFLVHLPKGFFASAGGAELVILLSLIPLFFAVRGGGKYSVDRVIGKEF